MRRNSGSRKIRVLFCKSNHPAAHSNSHTNDSQRISNMESTTARASSASSSTAAPQRRSKKSSSGGGNGSSAATVVTDQLVGQLERATLQLDQSRTRMQALHRMWELYLTVMAYLVMALSTQQVYVVSAPCRYDIQAINSQNLTDGAAPPVSNWESLLMVARDAAVPILGVIMACLLTFFLSLIRGRTYRGNVFRHPIFLACQACAVPILLLYYGHSRRDDATESNLNEITVSAMTCVAASVLAQWNVNTADLPSFSELPVKRQLPAALVLDGIMAISLYMMERQRAFLQKSARAVQELQRDLSKSGAVTGRPTQEPKKTK
jgi:hypothetical protein